MSKVFAEIGMSLDGFIAGPNGGPKNPLGDGGSRLHTWMFSTETFRRLLRVEDASETAQRFVAAAGEAAAMSPDDNLLQATFDRIGANVMGKRMFEEGEANWPEEAPFHTPVFVLTHESREPWVRPGGTTFHFVNDGIESVLRRAQAAAGEKDVRISGGAETIRQYLNAGLIDEFALHLAPVFLGRGVRLFDGVDRDRLSIGIVETVSSPRVTHLRYEVKAK